MSLQKFDLIELKWVSMAINEMLGPKFRVSTQSKVKIESDGRTEVVLFADRIPFAVDGIGSETLNISLEIYAKVNNNTERDEVLAGLNAVIGHKDGTITTDEGKTYNFASFLEFIIKPSGPPVVDTGQFMHMLNITGTMLVSDAEHGAIIANHVFTKLTVNMNGEEISGFIPTLRVDANLNFASESVATGNKNTLDVMHNARSVTREISAILLNRPLDMVIVRAITQVTDGFELNEVVTIERIYPAFTIKSRCKLLTGTLTESAGAYITYTLGFQDISSLMSVEALPDKEIAWKNVTMAIATGETDIILDTNNTYTISFDYLIDHSDQDIYTDIYYGQYPYMEKITGAMLNKAERNPSLLALQRIIQEVINYG